MVWVLRGGWCMIRNGHGLCELVYGQSGAQGESLKTLNPKP